MAAESLRADNKVKDNENNNVDNNDRSGDKNKNEDRGKDDEMSEEIYRSHRVTVESLNKTFPAPDELESVDITSNPDLYGRAPWFDRDVAFVDGLLDKYVQNEG